MFTQEAAERYSRNILLKEVGVAGQLKLSKGRVLIIGAGGLGSAAAMYLAAAGVGVIGIADGDAVELSNLQRQIIHSADVIGKPKAESARETLKALNPEIRIAAINAVIGTENAAEIIKEYDFVIDGTDNFPAKYLINDVCVAAGKPFSHAGVIQFSGQTMTYVPGSPCFRCVFPEPPKDGAVPNCREAGVLGVVPGIIGAVQAAEAIKYLLKIGSLLTGRLLIFDALNMSFRKAPVPRSGACVCGGVPTDLNDRAYGGAKGCGTVCAAANRNASVCGNNAN
ncbi:MAG: HesA/MoeB/ThiF family protein [Clostridiales bacterium]|jgi:molybdopterin/thiamine biosynthesis adenylyltransferase|nr:HesA/MoeB/ThiF family protein [Clostridiales bacterium]